MTKEDLILSLEKKVDKVHTQSLDLSFNELFAMYSDKELDINPDYQRLFRWTPGARSRFIESLLLEMPVPPIYVVESEVGSYQLIDGLQRFSSYLHLRGALEANHLSPPVKKGEFLELQECDIVTDLNGFTFETLPTSLKIRLKRAFVRVEVVRKGSDNRFRYHMFKRLNTGGEPLSQQQLRNCTIRMLDSKFIDFVIGLSKNKKYQKCIENISYTQSLNAFDQELVLRFLAFKNHRQNFVHDVADFLTEYMEKISDPDDKEIIFDYSSEEKIFDKTFSVLSRALGNKAFGRHGKDKIQSNFSVYHFEAICTGIQAVLQKIDVDNDSHIEQVKNKLKVLKADKDFIAATTGGGKNSPGPLKRRVEIATNKLSEINI
ncbi:hypothetical protein N836_12795 [Leptolyngbya sp. Heron Island J]|uniref:GmrSD restriction endonuclease domain-containing protein n=1 Tax=Leptolyngbya sp. Heron Island J TaxID=1385935 RepID=UPI0003B93D1E|nr:DUF262 domain-containing protein [Leptolyngbya sp. Heron Island J]ESA35248.1 hypothetical protein N836_12795 [Leptolyngbya sp. Heron Island J]